MLKPSFLGIGAQKAGTSWLADKLDQHPDVATPPWKEIQFFSHIFVRQHRRWTSWHTRQAIGNAIRRHVINAKSPDHRYVENLLRLADPSYMFTEDWYFDVFRVRSTKGKVLGEITPEYSTIPQKGIDYLKHLIGPVKIIYSIRHPVRRALSQMRMSAQRNGGSNVEWRQFVRNWDLFNRGDYAAYVPRWERAFDDDLLIIPFGDIATNPAGVIAQVEQHIGVARYDGYTGLEKKQHVSRAADIPKDVVSYLEQELEPQCAFLRDHFGQDFFERT